MAKSSNTTYLAKQWLIAGLVILIFGGSVLIGLIVALQRGQWQTVSLIVGSVILTGGILFVMFRTMRARVQTFLQQPTPTPFAQWYQTSLTKLPDAASHIASSQGTVYAYYGAYDQVRTCLAGVNWTNKVPLVAAQGLLLESLLNYLDYQRFEEGHRLALQARSQATISRAFPGTTQAQRAFDAYVLVGDVLCDTSNHQSLAQLEHLFPKLPLLVKVFVAWGLGRAYKQRNEQEKAARMEEFLHIHAPHCRGLNIP